MSTPFFSIIIPTRNRPVDFNVALQSVLQQACKDLEVIVVDDGTSANHLAEYKEIEEDNASSNISWIKLIKRDIGHGHCFARNQGVSIASGKYIGFLDDDDYWSDADFLSRAKIQIQHSEADVYYANQKAVKHDGTVIPNLWISDLPEKLPKGDHRRTKELFTASVSEMLLAGGFPHQNCSIIQKDLFLKIGGMDENLRYEPDLDIYLRTLDQCKTILVDTNIVSIHHVPDKSKSNNASTKTSMLEKKLFQLRTAEKGILFSKTKVVSDYCLKRKGFLVKQMSEELKAQGRWRLASKYALQGLVISPTFKWTLNTIFCLYKRIF